jgi:hypothetical protein
MGAAGNHFHVWVANFLAMFGSRMGDIPRVLDRWVSQFFIIGEEEVMVLRTWFPPLLLLSLLRLFDQEGWGIQSGETGVLG